MSGRAELRALTSARGIAAWLVVLYHLRHSLPGLNPAVRAVLDKGYLAVDFFFLLSGFVIALSWRERLRDGGWASVPTFLRRRFARVWPLHAVMLVGAVALALLMWATGRHDPRDFPFAELPLHILLVQNWGITDATAWNVPAWSISTEMFAYLLFPMVAMHARVDHWPTSGLLAAAGGIVAAMAMLLSLQGAETLGAQIARTGMIRCVAGFMIGTLLYEMWRRGGALALRSAMVGTLAGVAWALGLSEILAVPVLLASTLMLLAATSGARGNPLENAWLHRLGEWSYATYLAHYLMWKGFKLVFVAEAGQVGWPMIALYVAMVIVASAMLYRWVELPAQGWINQRRPARNRHCERSEAIQGPRA